MADSLHTRAEQEAADAGAFAVRTWQNYRTQTGGWWDCEGCGDCYNTDENYHVLEAFERYAIDAIHYACVALAERDFAALTAVLVGHEQRIRALEQRVATLEHAVHPRMLELAQRHQPTRKPRKP